MSRRLRTALSIVTGSLPSRPPAMHLQTSTIGFAIWWIVLILLHAVNAAYYAAAAKLYHGMRWTNVDFQLTMYSIGISPTQYGKVAIIHAIIAIVHIVFMIAMVVGSLQARLLVFLPKVKVRINPLWMCIKPKKLRQVSVQESGRSWRDSISRRVSSITEQSIALSSAVFGREGLLGVDSVYFDHLLLAREFVETTLQTIQAYRMSYLPLRVWFIRSYVVLLIVNCWSTPLVHRYYRHRHVKRRMMSLLCDLVLDIVSSIGVSLWIFATYVPQYTDPTFGFPFDKWFDDVWFATMEQEFQTMLVVSWADMATRLVFAAGLLLCIESIKEMLEPVKVGPSRAVIAETFGATTVKPKVAKPDIIKHVKKPRTRPRGRWSRFVHFILEKAGPALFLVLGFAILFIHIFSETRRTSSDISCQLPLHPWFVNKRSCSLVELDCHQLGGTSGSQESLEMAWNAFDFGAASRLIVRHCPQLEIPPTIQQYGQVTAIKLYNCTIATWSAQAALTTAAHPNMRALFAVRTKFPNGELPAGLLSTTFPQKLKAFVTSKTNLVNLPDMLNNLWPKGMTLAFEHSHFQVIPLAVMNLHPSLLSVAGSPISVLPREVFENPLLECALFSYTNVQELPRQVSNPSPSLYLLLLEGSNVSTFWSWMEPFVQLSMSVNFGFFNAYGSRYCSERDEIVAGHRRYFSIASAESNAHDLASVMDASTPAALQFAIDAVVCEPGFPFFFPLELQDLWWANSPV